MQSLPSTLPVPFAVCAQPLHVVESGRGVPVVLLHGLGSSHRDWERQIETLSGLHHVLALDLRGHGASPAAKAGVTVPELARDVARELDRRGLERCHVVGWSLGGMVAACLAAERDDLVRTLVVVNSPPSLEPIGLVEQFRWALRLLLTRHTPLGFVGAVIAQRLFVGGKESAVLRREFAERFATNDPASYRAVFEAITRHDDAGLLERVTCPVLVVAGERDYWPVSRKREQAARFPNARVAVVEESGHATPVERPEVFNALLVEFLSREGAHVPAAPARSIRSPLLGVALSLIGLTACGGGQAATADEGSGGGSEAGASAVPGSGASVASAGGATGTNVPASGDSSGGSASTAAPGAGGSTSAGDAAASTGGTPPVAPTNTPPTDPTPDPGSRCQVTDTTVFCEHNVTPFQATSTVTRNVYWQTPLTPAPKDGYPVVFLYQGSLFGPSVTWAQLTTGVPFGGFYQGLLQAKLLEKGFTVIAPEAQGGIAWQTNAGGTYAGTSDDIVVTALIAAVKAGHFGPADPKHLYATGISSGGYMTSRMAVSYPGVFRALAIQSGGYATCLGPLCTVPKALPADHPPTLFLHGAADTTVPIATMQPYHDELVAEGVDTALDVDPAAGHQWLADAPEKVPAWFLAH